MRLSKFRKYYWSSSKLANWIRGEDKPYALEWHKWEEWHKEQKQKRPIRYWLSDTFLKKLQDIVYFPIDIYYTVEIYIRNRYISKKHYLHTGLKPGEYYDLDYRILHALFNELVCFVEKELSHLNRSNSYKFENGRSIEAAYDYFKWANNLKHEGELTEQAKASRKIQKLYEWWKYERPNRTELFSNKTNDKFKYDLDLEYENEDTEMLIELIKIRSHLWT